MRCSGGKAEANGSGEKGGPATRILSHLNETYKIDNSTKMLCDCLSRKPSFSSDANPNVLIVPLLRPIVSIAC
jgi:hypothetical protein